VRRRIALGCGIAAAACALLAAVALSAPTPVKPPSISGTPAFDSTLTCHKGTWSPDAVSFDYAWAYAGGGPVFSTKPHWRADAPRIGYNVACQVTAHDAQGATTVATSAGVLITPGASHVRITKISGHHGTLTVSGIAGPRAALAASKYGKPYITLDRRINKTTVTQLGELKVLKGHSGRFTITRKDTPGHHTYIVQFVPSTALFNGTTTSRAFTLPR
jgi:hypothetical protein